jgi:hypothetical protein
MLGSRSTVSNSATAHDAWGISIRGHHGVRIESHGGSIDGYVASHIRFPESGFAVIALANTDSITAVDLALRLQRLVAPRLGPLDPRQPDWTQSHAAAPPPTR